MPCIHNSAAAGPNQHCSLPSLSRAAPQGQPHCSMPKPVVVLGRRAAAPPTVQQACNLETDLLGIHPIHPCCLEHTVVRLPAGVQDAVWEVLPAHQNAMQVALSAAVGDVAPVLLLVNLPQPGKPVEDAHLTSNTTNSTKQYAQPVLSKTPTVLRHPAASGTQCRLPHSTRAPSEKSCVIPTSGSALALR